MKIVMIILTGIVNLFGQASPEKYYIQPLKGEIVLDGIVDEQAWIDIEPLPLLTHWPQYGDPPSVKTEIRITYDKQYIYVSGVTAISPQDILAASYKRDIFTMGTDYLIFTLDNFNDNETALSFSTTPTGTRTDVAFSNDGDMQDLSWDTFWDSEAVYGDRGWSSEMRIPFSSISFQEKNGEVEMGMSVNIYSAKKYEMDLYPAIQPNWGFWSWAKPSQFQKIIFKDIKADNPIYVTPYFLFGNTIDNELNDPETAYKRNKQISRNLGLDVRYNVTNNLTADFSFNTDFAQVEADDQQVNLTRFSLFFPEKRRFFLERASIFDFNFSESNRLFYTRNIGLKEGENVDIIGGARLTGKIKDWEVGLLNVQTGDINSPVFKYSGGSNLKPENFGVVRLKHKIMNPRSYMGGMLTNRINADGAFNMGVGLDGLFNIYDNDYFSFALVQTHTDSVNDSIDFAEASRLLLRWQRRSYTGFAYDLSLERAGKEYRPGIGFEARDDFSHANAQISLGWAEKEHPYLQRHRFGILTDLYTRNADNSLETMEILPYWEGTFKSNYYLEAGFHIVRENLNEGFDLSDDVEVKKGKYNFTNFYTVVNTPGGQILSAETNFSLGSFFDGIIYSASITPIWIASKYLELSGYYEYNNINFDERDQNLISHIFRIKAQITLNTKISFSSFIQYNSEADNIFSNARFRYNPSEGHDLYIVYNDVYNSERGHYNPAKPLVQNRTILAKYTYTFTF